MTLFVKVSIGIVEHPKMLSVPREHRWAFVELLCYCARNLTDGAVPELVIPRLGVSREEVASLVWAGLLDESSDGYQVHDYTHWQTSRDLVEKRREAGRKGGLKSGIVRQGSKLKQVLPKQTNQVEASASEANEPEVEVEVEVEVERSRSLARRGAERDPNFDAFWSAYPRKVGKRTAHRAYLAARSRKATADDIFDGLNRLIPSWTDEQFIPHPTTWLNRDGWLDEPSAPAGAMGNLHDLGEQARRLEEGQRFFA